MALKLKPRTDHDARSFATVSDAERCISSLKLQYIGRRLSVALHPVDPNRFAISITAGIPMGFVA